MENKRIIVIHRWDGSPENEWYPYIKKELEDKNYQVLIPEREKNGVRNILFLLVIM